MCDKTATKIIEGCVDATTAKMRHLKLAQVLQYIK